MAAGNISKWDVHQWKLYFHWMGHVARMNPERWTHKVLRLKDLSHIAKLKEEFGHQTHGRRVHVWRLEWPLYRYVRNWMTMAGEAEEWQRAWIGWLHWRKNATIAG